jgi:hypothetical protein
MSQRRIKIGWKEDKHMLPRLMCAALALTLFSALAGAQKDLRRADTPGPELNISLVVVPVVFPMPLTDRSHARREAVTYSFSPSVGEFSVSQETRSMVIDGFRHEQVQLTTVVLK